MHVESLVAPHPVTFCQHVVDCVNHLRDKIGADIDAFDLNEKIIYGIQRFHRFFRLRRRFLTSSGGSILWLSVVLIKGNVVYVHNVLFSFNNVFRICFS